MIFGESFSECSVDAFARRGEVSFCDGDSVRFELICAFGDIAHGCSRLVTCLVSRIVLGIRFSTTYAGATSAI